MAFYASLQLYVIRKETFKFVPQKSNEIKSNFMSTDNRGQQLTVNVHGKCQLFCKSRTRVLKSEKYTFGECKINETKPRACILKMVSNTHLSSVDSLLADGAWIGFRVLMLMPRKAWNVGLKPEYKTSNKRVYLTLTSQSQNTLFLQSVVKP